VRRLLSAVTREDQSARDVPFSRSLAGAAQGPALLAMAVLASARVLRSSGLSQQVHLYLNGHSGCIVHAVRLVPLGLVAALTWFLLGGLARLSALVEEWYPPEAPGAPEVLARVRPAREAAGAGAALACAVLAMEAAGLPFRSLYASLGFLTLAFGLASQEVAKNILGGANLLLWRPFQPGDRVSFGSVSGKVLSIGAMRTEVVGADRQVIYCPNAAFNSAVVTNFSRREVLPFRFRFTLLFSPESAQDLDDITAAIRECLRGRPYLDESQAPQAYCAGISSAGIEVDVMAALKLGSGPPVPEARERCLLDVVEAVTARGARIAFPDRFDRPGPVPERPAGSLRSRQ